MKDTGSKLESKFQTWLKEIPCYSHKFADFKCFSYGIASNPHIADKIPKAPCDRLVIYKGKSFFFELKHTENRSLPFGNIKDHQVGSLLNHERKGLGKSYFAVEIDDLIYIITINQIADYILQADRQSFPLSYFQEHGIILKNKDDLQRLLER